MNIPTKAYKDAEELRIIINAQAIEISALRTTNAKQDETITALVSALETALTTTYHRALLKSNIKSIESDQIRAVLKRAKG